MEKFRDVQAIHFHLDINGKTVQVGCTSDMLYRVDELIAYISQFFTLKTGDILFTGTPAGVGPVNINDKLEGYLEDRKVLEFSCKKNCRGSSPTEYTDFTEGTAKIFSHRCHRCTQIYEGMASLPCPRSHPNFCEFCEYRGCTYPNFCVHP